MTSMTCSSDSGGGLSKLAQARLFWRRRCPDSLVLVFLTFLRFFACLSARYIIYNVQMTGDDLSKLRQQLRRAHDAAGRILQHLLRDQPMTPGSFYLQKRRCGKPNCRCARGQLHTAWVITRSQDGATRMGAEAETSFSSRRVSAMLACRRGGQSGAASLMSSGASSECKSLIKRETTFRFVRYPARSLRGPDTLEKLLFRSAGGQR